MEEEEEEAVGETGSLCRGKDDDDDDDDDVQLNVGDGESADDGEERKDEEKEEEDEDDDKAMDGDLVTITTRGTSVGRRSLGMFCRSEGKLIYS